MVLPLSTANIIVSPGERPFFDQMEAELRDEILPAGPLEHFAFQRLITANWQIERCRHNPAGPKKHEGRARLGPALFSTY
ncbi:MAG: hypothetical protein IT168_16075 [Bryobacterales bacterium]|nr:hypothetical protein [Bryobacterales bacterium]